MMVIDAIVKLENIKVAIQVKKVSYRKEASDCRFTRRLQTYADIIVKEIRRCIIGISNCSTI